MGSSTSGLPKVHPNVDSPSMPGLKTCVSDPLDKYCTRDEFFDELLHLLREPLLPWEQPALKSLEVTEVGPAERIVKVVLDGELMQDLNLPDKPAGDKDVIRAWLRLQWNRQKYVLDVHMNDIVHGQPETSVHINFLKDPFRIEAFFVMNRHNLDANFLAGIMEGHWVHPITGSFAYQKVKLTRNVESPFGNGDCVTITDPLEAFSLDFDTVWEEYLTGLKSHSAHCHELSDSRFELSITNPLLGGSDSKPLVRLIAHDKSKGEIVEVSSNDGLRLMDTRHIRIHRDPLRIETWTDADGKRVHRRQNVELLQFFLNHVVTKAKPQGAAPNTEGGGSSCSVQ